MRCFVALLPDAGARARLDEAAGGLVPELAGARRVAADNLHLTLAFLGEIDAAQAAAAAAALAQLAPATGTWRLDRLGAFPKSGAAWAAGAPDRRLEGLAASVREALDRLGLPYDRQAFAPHVTLLRRAGRLAPRALVPPVDWALGAAVLMVSARDAQGRLRYRPWQPA